MRGAMMISLIMFELFLTPLVLFTVTPPPGTSIPNPICDILPGYCTGLGIGSGTFNNPLNSTQVQQQQAQTNCGLGGALGGLAGGLAGLALSGGNPIAIAALFGFGFTGGCITSVSGGGFLSPYFNSFIGSLTSIFGPLGDFVHAFIIALGYWFIILKFFADIVNYEFWLFFAYPELGFFLGPIQGITIIIIFLYVAEYLRGIAGAAAALG